MNNNLSNHQYVIELAKHLKVKPAEVKKYLSVVIGERVSKDTVLASKKQGLGMSKIEIKSPVEGIVANLNEEKGEILLDATSSGSIKKSSPSQDQAKTEDDHLQTSTVPEGVTTEEKGVPSSESVVQSTKSTSDKNIVGVFGFGKGIGDGYWFEGEVEPRNIKPEMKGRVLLLKTMPSIHFFFKASAVGIEAIVVTTDDIDKAKDIGQEIAGRAQIGFLMVAEHENLKKFHNKRLLIDGKNKILGV